MSQSDKPDTTPGTLSEAIGVIDKLASLVERLAATSTIDWHKEMATGIAKEAADLFNRRPK
jgi:hypothetical protein